MTNLSNVELFRVYAGTTFAVLYETFPLSCQLNAEQIIDHCKLADDEDSRAQHLHLIEATWRWLEKTDYLDHNQNNGAYNLTPRSFEGLTFLDDADSGLCRGDKLRQLTQKVGGATAIESIAEIVSELLGSGAKAAYAFLA